MWIYTSTLYFLHNYMYKVSRNSVERFQRSCPDNCFSSISFWSNFLVQKGHNSEKRLNQNFLWICISTHYVFHYYKVSQNSVERFQWSWAYKKNRTDGLTVWLTDGLVKIIIPSITCWLGYNKNIDWYFFWRETERDRGHHSMCHVQTTAGWWQEFYWSSTAV